MSVFFLNLEPSSCKWAFEMRWWDDWSITHWNSSRSGCPAPKTQTPCSKMFWMYSLILNWSVSSAPMSSRSATANPWPAKYPTSLNGLTFHRNWSSASGRTGQRLTSSRHKWTRRPKRNSLSESKSLARSWATLFSMAKTIFECSFFNGNKYFSKSH